MAIIHGADAIGLVGKMPSGPGVIDDLLIAEIARTIPPAVSSFLRGFELALLLAGAILAAAGLLGFIGLRHLRSPAYRPRETTDVTIAS